MDHGSIVRGRIHENGPFYPRQYVPPGAEPTVGVMPLTDEQVEKIRARFERAARCGKVKVIPPLPRRVRLRLATQRMVDHVAIWLADHGRYRAARALWRAFEMLGRR